MNEETLKELGDEIRHMDQPELLVLGRKHKLHTSRLGGDNERNARGKPQARWTNF